MMYTVQLKPTEQLIQETIRASVGCALYGGIAYLCLGSKEGIEDIVKGRFVSTSALLFPPFIEEHVAVSLTVPTIRTSQGVIAPCSLGLGSLCTLGALGEVTKVAVNVATLAYRCFQSLTGVLV